MILCRTDLVDYNTPNMPLLAVVPKASNDPLDDFCLELQEQSDAEELMNNILCHDEELYSGVLKLLIAHALSNNTLEKEENFKTLVQSAIDNYLNS